MSNLCLLHGVYDSYECDIAEDFYIPLLENSILFDRIACYFSSKALASYAKGLEAFAKKPNAKYRLLISTDVSKEDYEAMVAGEERQKEIDNELAARMREDLSLEEEKHLSNLSYLISIGVVEIKMAYIKKGIFHHKMGYAESDDGTSIFFMGSNNETEASIRDNYESFMVIDGDNQHYRFLEYWNGLKDGVTVRKPSETIWAEIDHYNKGRIIDVGSEVIPDDSIYLGYSEGELFIDVTLVEPPTNYSLVQKSRINRFVDVYTELGGIKFKNNLNYIQFLKIVSLLEDYCLKNNYMFIKSRSLEKYLNSRNLFIKKRYELGIAIKRRESVVEEQYTHYKKVVDSLMTPTRPLHERQMWDSFFMYTMKKAGNFSVPGSGKTSSVLGVYAFSKYKGEIKRIVMIGPLNSFDSWIDEYKLCFNGEEPKLFDNRYNSGSPDRQRSILLSEYAAKNLLLFNYESLEKYSDIIRNYIIEDSLLVFDEAHKIKSMDAIRSINAREISENSTRTIIMTGTPMPNSYLDLYNPLMVLFPSEYESFFGFRPQTLSNPSDSVIEELNRKIQPFFCRTSKKDLKVPDPNKDEDVICKANDIENILYHKILDRYKDNRLALVIRILQMESDPHLLLRSESGIDNQDGDGGSCMELFDRDSSFTTIDISPNMSDCTGLIEKIKISTKTQSCLNKIKDLVSENKTVIVWCIFTKSINNIESHLKDAGISVNVIYGGTSLAERTKIIDDFKKGHFSVLVTNPHTLAESVSLHECCHDAIYFEYSYNLVHLLQSKDRIHRLGLKEGQYTQYYFMKNDYNIKAHDSNQPMVSLDDVIYKRLKEKEKNMLDAIEYGKLEASYSSKDDIDYIFHKMGWD